MIALKEPVRWENLLSVMNWIYNNMWPVSQRLIETWADIFVFAIPVFLVRRYIMWIKSKNKSKKYESINIFWSGILAILINIILQEIFIKARPESHLQTQDRLIFDHLPTAPFPSDHAAMMSAITFAILLVWYETKSKTLKSIWYAFMIFSIITVISRIMGGIHRPTDIIAGLSVWLLSAAIIHFEKTNYSINKYINWSLIKIEERISNFICEKFKK